MEVDHEAANNGVTAIIFVFGIPVVVALCFAVAYPKPLDEYAERMFSGNPLKNILKHQLEKRGVEWGDVEPLLQKLSFNEVIDAHKQGGIAGVLKLVVAKGGSGAKRVLFIVARPLLRPISVKLNLDEGSIQGLLETLSIEELELAYKNPIDFAKLMGVKLAKFSLRLAMMPMLNTKGFEWDFFAPMLENLDSIEDIHSITSDPLGFVEGLASQHPIATRMLGIMKLQGDMQPKVEAEKITWKEAVGVMCNGELVPMEEIEVAREDPSVLLSIIVGAMPQMRWKLREKMRQVQMLESARSAFSKNNKVVPISGPNLSGNESEESTRGSPEFRLES
jgi:hypothetical protein